jgi:excisionase family DNA binding protein
MPPSSDLLTPDEAGKYLRCAKQTLARWRCEGGGPAYVKMGTRVLYRRVDLDAWIVGRRLLATAQRPEAA